ncbi:MAG: hypothetical protein ACRDI3_05985 [Actinomycetota bacterium]
MDAEWDHSMRCPHCGGLNDLEAEWCMQCTKRLKPVPKKVDIAAGPPGAREIVGGALDIVAGPGYESDDEGLRQAFSVGGKKVTWNCSRCGYSNPIETQRCADCGRSFIDTAQELAAFEVSKKGSYTALKAISYVLVGAVLMRLVAGLISPWAAAAVLGGALLRFLLKYLRN